MKSKLIFLLLSCFAMFIVGCGQTGPLYLPKKGVLVGAPQNGILPHPPSNSNG